MTRRRRPGAASSILLALLAAAVVLRLAQGYGWCTECWNWDGRRQNTRDGLRWPAGDGAVITYINGIFHSVPEWEKITGKLEALFGHEVRPFYNPSSGWWITDASKAGYHLLRKPANDTIAQALGEHLAQAVEDVGRGRVLHIAHSGGALITYLAAQNHLTRGQRDKIDVLTFGGARSITRKYFPGRVVNYYARNDPLVRLDRRAAELMKLTNNTTLQSVSDKHESVFVFLEGRARQFVLDHSLEGPTYQHALKKEARAFRRAHFGPLSPLSWDYDTSLVRLARKRFAQVSGVHGFFSTDYWNLRSWQESLTRHTGLSSHFGMKDLRQASVDGHDRQPAMGAQAAGTLKESSWLSSRRGWPWERGTDEQTNTDGAHSLAVVAQGEAKKWSRWSLGWRWYPGKSKQETAEGVGFGERADPVVDEAPSESPRLRNGRFWSGWGFQPEAVPEPGSGVVDGMASTADASSQGETAGAGASAEDGNTVEDGNVPPNVDGRPWLSFGWSPRGAAPTSSRDDLQTVPIDAKPMMVDSEGSAGAEQQLVGGEDVTSVGEEALKFVLEQGNEPGNAWWWSGRSRSNVERPGAEKEGDVADVLAEEKASSGAGDGKVGEASTVPQENERVLAGDQNAASKSGWWWSSKSQRDMAPATMDEYGVGSRQRDERYTSSVEDDDTNAEEVNATLKENEDTIPESTPTSREATSWWWAGNTQREVGKPAAGGGTDPTAGQETGVVNVSDRGIEGEAQGGGLSDGIRDVPADTAEEADTRHADHIGGPVLRSWRSLSEYMRTSKNPGETADVAAVVSEEAAVEGGNDMSLSMFAEDNEGANESGLDTGVRSWWSLGKDRRKSKDPGETADVAAVVAGEAAVEGEFDKPLSMREEDGEAVEDSYLPTADRSWWSLGKGIRTSRDPEETADAVAVVSEETALEGELDKPLSMFEEGSQGAEESDRDTETRSWWSFGKGMRTSKNPEVSADVAAVVAEESATEGETDKLLSMFEEDDKGVEDSDHDTEVNMMDAETPPRQQSATRATVSSWASWRRRDSFQGNHGTAESSNAGPSTEPIGGEEEALLKQATMDGMVVEGERFTAEVILADESAPVGLRRRDDQLGVKDALWGQGSGDSGDSDGADDAFDSQAAAGSGGDERSRMAMGDSDEKPLADNNTTRPLLPPTGEDNLIPEPVFDAGLARAEGDAEKASEMHNISGDIPTESAESKLGDDSLNAERLAEIGDETAKSGEKEEGDEEPSRARRDLSSDAATLDTMDTCAVANIDER